MEEKINISLKPIKIPVMVDPNLKELAEKINQIVFVINQLNIKIMKEDVLANAVWQKVLEENK
jgi:hypothetical protein